MTKTIIESVDALVAKIMGRITEAAKNHDLTSIEVLTKSASELNDIKERLSQIGARLNRLTSQTPAPARINQATTGLKLREFKIEVTEGAIRQNLLTMTEPLQRRLVKPDEQFSIEVLPSGERIKTTLLASGNKLQERGAINRFYRNAHVKGGDHVLLTEIAAGEWTLQKFPSSENGH